MNKYCWSRPLGLWGAGLLIFGFLVANAFVSLTSAWKMIHCYQETQRLLTFLLTVEGTLSTLKDAETGERGYVITGDVSYLEPYEDARKSVGVRLDRIQRFASAHPEIQGEATALDKLVGQKLHELEAVVRARAVSREAATRLVASNDGKSIMDEIRQITGGMLRDARTLLQAQADASRNYAARLEAAILLGMVVGMLLVACIGYFIHRHHQSMLAAETGRSESHRMARSTLNALQSHIAILDAGGQIIATNRAWRVFALLHDSYDGAKEGTNYLQICDSAVGPGSDDAAAVARGIRSILDGELDEFEYEYTCHSDDENRWFLVRVSRFEEVGPLRLVVSHENVTKIKQADLAREQAYNALQESHIALRNSEEQYRALADAMPQMVWCTSRCGKAEYFNQGWLSYTERTLQECVGNGWFSSLHPDDRQATREKWMQAIKSGDVYTAEYRVRRGSDGEYRWHLARGVPLRDATGSILRWYGTTTDVDDQKRLNQDLQRAKVAADEANRAKSQFVANISHEIRTPMNGVLGMTELLLESNLTRDQRESLELVKSSAESLMSIINDLLDYSKIEARGLRLVLEAFSPFALVETTLSQLALRAHSKGLELIGDIDRDLPPKVVGDPNRLRQVIVNLVGNAVKFTDSGEVKVSVALKSVADSDVTIEFQVTDTGIGIPDDKHKLIFDPFTQADNSLTRQYGGTGLGLSISSQLVAMMGGELRVESAVGKGSTFSFNARFTSVNSDTASGTQDKIELSGVKVLIVDDNATNRHVLHEMLLRWGTDAATESNGIDAIDNVAREFALGQPYDLVLVDAGMPHIDGFEVARRLKALSGSASLAIMMITSAHRQDDADRCRELGVGGYLIKPVRRPELANAIREMLSRSQDDESDAVTANREGGQFDPKHVPARGRILVAEDHPVNQRVVRGMLERHGHAVVIVSTGRQAVDEAKRRSFDLILMDLQMPDVDGIEATAQIRQLEQVGSRRTPIVAMTSHARASDRDRCFEQSMDGYISKPIDQHTLQSTIQKLLQPTSRLAEESTPTAALPECESPAQSDEDSPLFDIAALARRTDNDTLLMKELVALFLETTPQQLDYLNCVCKQGSREMLERAAHAFRGAALSIGAESTARHAESLELASRDREFALIESLLDDLVRECERLRAVLSEQQLETV